jgi:hypothetical protein
MSSIGQRLHAARIERGLSISQLAARTKIQTWILLLIEADDFSRLPGGVYVRGFIAAVSREVGLDPAIVVAEFTAMHAPEPMPAQDPAVGPTQFNSRVRHIGWSLTAAVVLLALARLVPQSEPTAKAVSNVSPATVTPAVINPQPTRARFAQTESTDEPLPHRTDGLILALRAVDTVWLEVAIDGDLVLYRLMQAGEERELTATGEIALLVGDAAALRYWINGMPGRRLGHRGQVREIHITPEHYRSFLATEPDAVGTGA